MIKSQIVQFLIFSVCYLNLSLSIFYIFESISSQIFWNSSSLTNSLRIKIFSLTKRPSSCLAILIPDKIVVALLSIFFLLHLFQVGLIVGYNSLFLLTTYFLLQISCVVFLISFSMCWKLHLELSSKFRLLIVINLSIILLLRQMLYLDLSQRKRCFKLSLIFQSSYRRIQFLSLLRRELTQLLERSLRSMYWRVAAVLKSIFQMFFWISCYFFDIIASKQKKNITSAQSQRNWQIQPKSKYQVVVSKTHFFNSCEIFIVSTGYY